MSVTTEGFLPTDYADRRAAIATRFVGLAGGNVATDEGTVEGDIITLLALTAQQTEDQLVLTYASSLLREAAGAPLKRRLQPQTMQRGGAQSHPPHACSCRCSPAPSA